MEAIPEMKGIIIFKESNKKSKSQGFFPYLETASQGFRIAGMYMNLLPLLTLLDFQ